MDSSTYADPIGISYCRSNGNIIDVAVAKQGFHRQLHHVYKNGTPTTDFRPLDKTDGASAFAWQKISKRSGLVKGKLLTFAVFRLTSN